MVSPLQKQSWLSDGSKEAIKVGLAVSLTIFIAFSLGWERSYWGAIAVFSIAATESYSNAVVKEETRLLGTLIGIVLAVIIVALFSQNRAGYIAFLSVGLCVCTFMASHKRFGYVFIMSFVICITIAGMGPFNAENIFSTLVTRIQENVLGIVVYSLVFRLVWPKKAEDIFFKQFAIVEQDSRQYLAQMRLQCELFDNQNSEAENKCLQTSSEKQIVRLYKLKELITGPLLDSPKLDHEKKYWYAVVDAYLKFEQLLSLKSKGEKIDPLLLQEGIGLLQNNFSYDSYDKQKIARFFAWSDKAEKRYLYEWPPVSAFSIPLLERCRNTLRAVSILLTGLAFWIFIPMPGGSMMSTLSANFAINVSTQPSKLMRYVGRSAIVTAIVILAQLVFIMPVLTEGWQIAGLFFFNAVIIYKIAEIPGFELQKLLATNFSAVFAMGALQLVPTFEITTTLMMVTYILITLGIIVFYNKLYNGP